MTVRAAGHDAAADRPEEVAGLVKNFINGTLPNASNNSFSLYWAKVKNFTSNI